MSVERTFVDTNILLYAYDVEAGAAHVAAAAALRELWESRAGVLSTQVLNEFIVNARRKWRPTPPGSRVEEIVSRYRVWPVHRPDVDDLIAASRLQTRVQLSYWDALIVQSAIALRATRIYSQDLNAGQIIEGVRVVNPLVGSV